eukprot:scaffold513_cov22-Tisochrysis_lutea.AAC.1
MPPSAGMEIAVSFSASTGLPGTLRRAGCGVLCPEGLLESGLVWSTSPNPTRLRSVHSSSAWCACVASPGKVRCAACGMESPEVLREGGPPAVSYSCSRWAWFDLPSGSTSSTCCSRSALSRKPLDLVAA